MARMEWRDTHLGNDNKNLKLDAAENNGRVYLRLKAMSGIPRVQERVIGLPPEERDYGIRYEPAEDELADQLLEKGQITIENIFQSISPNGYVEPTIQSALPIMKRIEPIEVTLTGQQDEILAIYEMVLNH